MATKQKAKKVTESVTPAMPDANAQPTTPPTQGQAPAAPDLTISDLKNIGIILDVASTRGAFRANEMATIGLVYNKLQGFLARVAPETKPEDNKTATATATTTATAPGPIAPGK